MQTTTCRQSLILFSLGILLFASTACQKDIVSEQSGLELLTGRSWQLTNLYYQETGDNALTDFTGIYYKSCEMDDSYNFTTDLVFRRNDRDTICQNSPYFGLYGSANWSADSAFSNITFNSFPNYLITMEIKTLTESRLELQQKVRDYFQKEGIFTFRFKSLK